MQALIICAGKSLNEAITQDDTQDARAQLQQSMVNELVMKALQRLPLRQKNAVILKHFERLTIVQISGVLGCSPSSVKTHLLRAARALRSYLGGYNALR